jgi:hypothetical protein
VRITAGDCGWAYTPAANLLLVGLPTVNVTVRTKVNQQAAQVQARTARDTVSNTESVLLLR